MDKINIYINSKNRDLSEQISNFTVRIPQNLLRLSQGEYFTLNVNGFYCYNSWFNCIDNFNNEFHIIIKNMQGQMPERVLSCCLLGFVPYRCMHCGIFSLFASLSFQLVFLLSIIFPKMLESFCL